MVQYLKPHIFAIIYKNCWINAADIIHNIQIFLKYSGAPHDNDPAERRNRMTMPFCDRYSDSQNRHFSGGILLDNDLVCALRTV